VTFESCSSSRWILLFRLSTSETVDWLVRDQEPFELDGTDRDAVLESWVTFAIGGSISK
jgi:hypothetical protein